MKILLITLVILGVQRTRRVVSFNDIIFVPFKQGRWREGNEALVGYPCLQTALILSILFLLGVIDENLRIT